MLRLVSRVQLIPEQSIALNKSAAFQIMRCVGSMFFGIVGLWIVGFITRLFDRHIILEVTDLHNGQTIFDPIKVQMAGHS